MNKENLIYMCNGILFSLRKKKILLFVTTWMKLENTLLSKTLSESHESERKMPHDASYMKYQNNQTHKAQIE
jgi:hypothetical protein